MRKSVLTAVLSGFLLMGVVSCAGVKTYTVTWDLNYEGATVWSPSKVEEGKTITRPESDPERSGYTFLDWYLESECTTTYDFTLLAAADITLYAGWEVKEITRADAIDVLGAIVTVTTGDDYVPPKQVKAITSVTKTIDDVVTLTEGQSGMDLVNKYFSTYERVAPTGADAYYTTVKTYLKDGIYYVATSTTDNPTRVTTSTYYKYTGAEATAAWDALEENLASQIKSSSPSLAMQLSAELSELPTPLPVGAGELYRSSGAGNVYGDSYVLGEGGEKKNEVDFSFDDNLIISLDLLNGVQVGNYEYDYEWGAFNYSYPDLSKYTEVDPV